MENQDVQISDYTTVLPDIDLNEIIDETLSELEGEDILKNQKTCIESKLSETNRNVPCRSFWKNIYRSWTKPSPERKMVVRFQKLAGIISGNTVAALILPNNQRVEFKELPPWWNVLRYKIAGFTYETYESI